MAVDEIQKLLDEYKRRGQNNDRTKKIEAIRNDMLKKLSYIYSVENESAEPLKKSRKKKFIASDTSIGRQTETIVESETKEEFITVSISKTIDSESQSHPYT